MTRSLKKGPFVDHHLVAKADKAAGGLAVAAAADAGEPSGGRAHARASARPLPPPLPPHIRLTRAQLAERAPRTERGEWYGLPVPTSFAQLRGPAFGAPWLTAAMRAAGSLADGCSVRRDEGRCREMWGR